jgi:hypothetical protein
MYNQRVGTFIASGIIPDTQATAGSGDNAII